MIKINKAEVVGFEQAIRGMRNPMNSWDKSDSGICKGGDDGIGCSNCVKQGCEHTYDHSFQLGKNDYELMAKLRNAGTDHRKFMRMIAVYVDLTAPLYWWKEFDTYKVGTVANSCSTMHKIQAKEFEYGDFSCEYLIGDWCGDNCESFTYYPTDADLMSPQNGLEVIVCLLNASREAFLKTGDKKFWWQMIQLLPSSYNQKRTVMLNYEVLANIYKSRCNHKLDEWHTFCDWIEDLPYDELIIGEKQNVKSLNELRVEQGLPPVTDKSNIINKLCAIGNLNPVYPNDLKIGIDLINGKDFNNKKGNKNAY